MNELFRSSVWSLVRPKPEVANMAQTAVDIDIDPHIESGKSLADFVIWVVSASQ